MPFFFVSDITKFGYNEQFLEFRSEFVITELDCISAAVCDGISSKCLLPVLTSCYSTSECVTGSSCDSNVCNKNVNQVCINSIQCKSGTICDSILSEFRYVALQPCTDGQCETIASCENSYCKYLVYHSCQTDQQCENGAVCENNVCKFGLDELCVSDGDCINTCVCDL